MTRGVSWFFVAPLVLLGLSGCKFGLEQREPWRTEAEERCVAGGLVKPSAYIVPIKEVEGAGTCGMDRPFRVSALNGGAVEISPRATLACPVISRVDRWLLEDIQPAAIAWFGVPVAKVKQMASYSCRNMNGTSTRKISEHAFGNAFDIGGFVLADGREVNVRRHWNGKPDERGFLRTVQATACTRFSTVLGPGSNRAHADHFHVDLMRRASGRVACNPKVVPPTPPNLPVYKAPPLMSSGTPAWSVPEPAAIPASMEVESAPDEGYVSDEVPMSSAPLPSGRAPAPMPVSAAPAPGAPVMLSPGSGYGHGVDPAYRSPTPNYGTPVQLGQPGSDYPAPSQANTAPSAYPTTQGASAYPGPGAPPQNFPAQGYPASGYPAPGGGYPSNAYPANQPASGYLGAYPPPAAAPRYPGQAAPPPAPRGTNRPPGVPLPPAGIPLAKWLGLDTTPTGSTGSVRSFVAERQFASPIPEPRDD